MGTLFRSQPMELVHVYMARDAALDTVDELGKIGRVQFVDLNPGTNSFQRPFASEVKRCAEMERQLRFFRDQILATDGVRLRTIDDAHSNPAFQDDVSHSLLDSLEHQFRDISSELKNLNDSQARFDEDYYGYVEYRFVLETNAHFFAAAGGRPTLAPDPSTGSHSSMSAKAVNRMTSSYKKTDTNPGDADEMVELSQKVSMDRPLTQSLHKMGGMIRRDQRATLERILWRTGRGNIVIKTAEVDQPMRGPDGEINVLKDVFLLWFRSDVLKARVTKICESLDAHLYRCPDSPAEEDDELSRVYDNIEEIRRVREQTTAARRRLLDSLSYKLPSWCEDVQRLKQIHIAMNGFSYDSQRNTLVGMAWVPRCHLDETAAALRRATQSSGVLTPSFLEPVSRARSNGLHGKSIGSGDDGNDAVGPAHLMHRLREADRTPPTYFITTKYTGCYQTIIDMYGVPRYQEVNPTPFTMVTFPFFFAIMFGDVGHGLLLTLAAYYLVRNEAKLETSIRSEYMRAMFVNRYLLLAMGVFSTYTGLLYNEFFSVPLQLFGETAWRYDPTRPDGDKYYQAEGLVYPFGVDPAWVDAENALAYLNSVKMKASIIIAVIHMACGMYLSVYNARFFKRPNDITWEIIPGFVFFLSLMGHLVLVIFIKWFTPREKGTGDWDLIALLINMVLAPGSVPDGQRVYPGQAGISFCLFLAAMLSVPLMLLSKPWIAYREHNRHGMMRIADQDEDEEEAFVADGVGDDGHGGGSGEFNAMDVFIRQMIHTIEFVLGAISNTASYLRLWALSLAHSQLSKVLWEQVILQGLESGSIVVMFLSFGMWAACTIAILMGMEVMSAFLHALRLHWIEFNSKFFTGDGVRFIPLSFAASTLPLDKL